MGLQAVFIEFGVFIACQGSHDTGIPREQAHLRKSKPPRISPEKWIFLSLASKMNRKGFSRLCAMRALSSSACVSLPMHIVFLFAGGAKSLPGHQSWSKTSVPDTLSPSRLLGLPGRPYTHTHTGNCEVTVQVPLTCYSRPGP